MTVRNVLNKLNILNDFTVIDNKTEEIYTDSNDTYENVITFYHHKVKELEIKDNWLYIYI